MKKLSYTYSNGVEIITIKHYTLADAEKKARKQLKGVITLTELKF